jgi:hypothetical protein
MECKLALEAASISLLIHHHLFLYMNSFIYALAQLAGQASFALLDQAASQRK